MLQCTTHFVQCSRNAVNTAYTVRALARFLNHANIAQSTYHVRVTLPGMVLEPCQPSAARSNTWALHSGIDQEPCQHRTAYREHGTAPAWHDSRSVPAARRALYRVHGTLRAELFPSSADLHLVTISRDAFCALQQI